MKTQRIAFVTYNRIGDGQHPNDIIRLKGKEIYLAQNGHRSKWAADPSLNSGLKVDIRRNASSNVVQQVQLQDMDKVYLYVGAAGGEEGIKATQNLDPSKVIYVMCSCDRSIKISMIERYNGWKSKIIGSECGGQRTMQSLLEQELQ